MRFAYWPGPHHSWDDTLAIARHAESTGWDGIWYADHFMPNAEDNSGPTNECWTTLGAIAASVPRVRLGSLVTGNTYRNPALLAKMAATVDNISGGRVVLGLGSGWQENEHAAYDIPFYTVGGRLRRLDEACEVITRLFANDKSNYEGKYYALRDAPLAPKPLQRPLPLLIGGGGEQLTLRIAAKYANEWNVWGDPQRLREKMAVLDQRCEEIGRDPKEIERSANAILVLTEDASVMDRMKRSGRPIIGGSIAQVQETLGEYQEAGVHEIIIPDFGGGPVQAKFETMDRFLTEAAKPFRG